MAADLFDPDPVSGARISECGRYRYLLWRVWGHGPPAACFVMLNPSTADASQDDPTIRKCIGFAKRWGCGGIVVANVFAYRATDPSELREVADPYGPENDQVLVDLPHPGGHGPIVVAWGTKCRWGRGRGRVKADRRALIGIKSGHPARAGKIFALRVTKGGFPQHPLYVPYSAKLVHYTEAPE